MSDEASPADPKAFRVLAIISTFNEGDVIGSVLQHLIQNGVDAYLIDNRSTDDTVQQAARWLGQGLIGIEQFPPDGEGPEGFAWGAILERKMALTRELQADWYMHHDADELRLAPWPATRLRDAVELVDRLGYNAIDFRVLNFPPTDDGFRAGMDPLAYFTRWEDPAEYDLVQIKCWKGSPEGAELADGGHRVEFEGRRVFPIRFLLCHYPVRGQTHGARKVIDERRKRFLPSERDYGWHRQYDHVVDDGHVFLRNPGSLKPFDLERLQILVELEATGAPDDAKDAPAAPPGFQGQLESVDAGAIVGWAWGGEPGGEPVEVDLWAGGQFLGVARADRFRADLLEAGKGDGHAAFVFPTPSHLSDGRPHWIWANLAGTSVPLRNSPYQLVPTVMELQA